MIRQSRYLLLLTFFLISTAFAAATQIKLYAQPEKQAKVIATIEDQAHVIPIFHKKNSPWIKVADTRNGTVGWVKIKDIDLGGMLLRSQGREHFSSHQTIIESAQSMDGKKPRHYPIIEYTDNGHGKLDKKEADKQMKAFEARMEEHSQRMRRFFGVMLRDLLEDFSAHFPAMFPELFEDGNEPMMIIREKVPAKKPSWWESLKSRVSGGGS